MTTPRTEPFILFVGDDWYGSNATSLRNAFMRLGASVLTLDSTALNHPGRYSLGRVLQKAQGGEPRARLLKSFNQRVVDIAHAVKPDVVLGFKAIWLTAETLEYLRPASLVHYHPDNSSEGTNVSHVYSVGETRWDLHVTTKTFNVPELTGRGARNVLYLPCAYDRDWHRPVHLGDDRRYAIGFVGTRRADRTPSLRSLADQYGKDLLICGGGWRDSSRLRRVATVLPEQYGIDMSIAIGRTDINLGLLNDRDLHTCRSYEVPAAGGLLLAQRTREHEMMFDDRVEAVLYSSPEERAEHIAWLRSDLARLRAIAAAGSRRVRATHNTYEDRASAILSALS